MSYERDRAFREQEATEAMIAMRDKPGGLGRNPPGPHPDPLASAMSEIRNALRVSLAFLEGFEGDELQDGIDERIDTVRSALKAAEALS